MTNRWVLSGEVVLLEVTELDDERASRHAFELVDDEAVAAEVYADFRDATKDLYDFCGLMPAWGGDAPLFGLRPSFQGKGRGSGVLEGASGRADPVRTAA